MSLLIAQHRAQAQVIFRAALNAVQADRLVHSQLHWDGTQLRGNGFALTLHPQGRLWVVGAGKATAHLAAALEDLLGNRISGGGIVVKDGHSLALRHIAQYEASHPVPDARGLAATAQLLHQVQAPTAQDTVIVLLTGGASALLTDVPAGLSLQDLQTTSTLLLRAGASIAELNAVRKHLSAIKGGQLLRRLQPAQVLTLVVSDVIGDPLDVIASGPTVPDPSTYADAWAVLQQYDLVAQVPQAVCAHLQQGMQGLLPETLKDTQTIGSPHHLLLLGHIRMALQAAEAKARSLGYASYVLQHDMQGQASDAGRALLLQLQNFPQNDRPLCLLKGGETTVQVRGQGLGGRNQELALAAGLALAGTNNLLVMAAGTDGTDGPTDAAGAWADGALMQQAQALQLSAQDHLARNDSYPFFRQVGGLLMTGPTGTNVMDVAIGLRW